MKEHSSTLDTTVGKSTMTKRHSTSALNPAFALTTCMFTLIVLYTHRGIAWAPACGKAIAELVLKGKCSSVNLAPFDPSRFTPNAGRGGRGRKKRGASVGEQW